MRDRQHRLRVSVISIGLFVAVWCSRSMGQTSGLSATLVLRTQASSVADETYAHLRSSLTSGGQIGVAVEGGSAKGLVENAFLDLLGKMGLHVILVGVQSTSRITLQVVVLDQSVRYSNLSNGEYRREIQTAIEARRIFGDSAATEYIGLFKRHDIDTVAFREDAWMAGQAIAGERSLFDRLAGPVILIAGAFLVVYLFFTVRN